MSIQIQQRSNVKTAFDPTLLHSEVRAAGLNNSDAAKVVAKTQNWMNMAKQETPTGPMVDYRDLSRNVTRNISKIDPVAADKFKQRQPV